ncbi:hypothetical protein CERZMDRAFT_92552 [Cercospora zeae-maydis SCOH1-5]|uniref:Uncharacterized protein n=1 Tax=Cercospora zeae-maydis SCOH1-5 TaxID=717836 RepID=A0A6A6FX00_9PEZI|nr:hypothetical protein CERZMDRAFT_92552 [Cercospora zeae-maydis SCOH1-5]
MTQRSAFSDNRDTSSLNCPTLMSKQMLAVVCIVFDRGPEMWNMPMDQQVIESCETRILTLRLRATRDYGARHSMADINLNPALTVTFGQKALMVSLHPRQAALW